MEFSQDCQYLHFYSLQCTDICVLQFFTTNKDICDNMDSQQQTENLDQIPTLLNASEMSSFVSMDSLQGSAIAELSASVSHQNQQLPENNNASPPLQQPKEQPKEHVEPISEENHEGSDVVNTNTDNEEKQKTETQPHQEVTEQQVKVEEQVKAEHEVKAEEPASVDKQPVKTEEQIVGKQEMTQAEKPPASPEKVAKTEQPVRSSAKPAEISVKIFEQKLKSADELKKSGNVFFKQKCYVEAIREYSSALRLLDPTYFSGASREECQKMAEVSAILLCNMGFCYFNSFDMQRAQIFFSEAIVINPKYTKALHKRALSRFELMKYQQAFEDIKLAFSLQKSNADIHQSYSKILEKYNQQKKQEKQKIKELSSKIFSNKSEKQPVPKPINPQQKKQQPKQNKDTSSGWNWTTAISIAGTAAIIGTTLYKMFKN